MKKRNIGQEILEGIREIKEKNLIAKCMKIIECDTARIRKSEDWVGGKMFLIIGFNRNTKDDPGQWVDENGKERDWDYVEEKTVASGKTEEELIESAKEYKRLCGMTMEEYLTEIVND